ncbi:hypothetical protein VI817_008880 [Penicillium citrinum]|nr:hypothetical protein VI817_008880 [Penicillium citrinum]
MNKRILHVVTNVAHYDDPSHPTGLWLSELTHAWHVFEEHGFEQTIVSPKGGLQQITREIFERGGVVSSVCHGYCGLLNTKLSDGSYLVAGRKMTGFTWREEVLACVNKLVPYNAEEEVKNRGAHYQSAKLPFVSYTVVDGNLVTGQNPGSAKDTASKVVTVLSRP